VRVLQENNGRQCTKLLMQNYSACGDFIPEKIVGVGVVGKYAYLHPVDEEQCVEGDEQTYEEWVRNSTSDENGEGAAESSSHEEVSLDLVSTLSSTIQTTAETETAEAPPPSPVSSLAPQAEERVVVDKVIAIDDNDPATVDREEKISASSTIETVVPLHNSLQLVSVRWALYRNSQGLMYPFVCALAGGAIATWHFDRPRDQMSFRSSRVAKLTSRCF